jgi:hypothetical protein
MLFLLISSFLPTSAATYPHKQSYELPKKAGAAVGAMHGVVDQVFSRCPGRADAVQPCSDLENQEMLSTQTEG